VEVTVMSKMFGAWAMTVFWQVPPMQAVALMTWHLWLHTPQFCGSTRVSTHVVPHFDDPASALHTQSPATQTADAPMLLQLWPQAPQLFTSVCKFVQRLLQNDSPASPASPHSPPSELESSDAASTWDAASWGSDESTIVVLSGIAPESGGMVSPRFDGPLLLLPQLANDAVPVATTAKKPKTLPSRRSVMGQVYRGVPSA
jgi:hypothetical protein